MKTNQTLHDFAVFLGLIGARFFPPTTRKRYRKMTGLLSRASGKGRASRGRFLPMPRIQSTGVRFSRVL